MRKLSRSLGLALVVGVAVICVVWWLRTGGGASPHSTQWRQVDRDGEIGLYVDNRRCAACHPDEAAGHAQTGHAHTFHLTPDFPTARQLAGKTFSDPERPYRYRFHFDEQQGLSVTIPEQFGEEHFPLPFAFGSGHNAVTFLTLLPSRQGDTVGVEHRVSLYAGKNGWEMDLTPGHAAAVPQQDIEHFGKVLRGDKLSNCIGCHTTTAQIAGQDLLGLRANVGCQSCHGPGREHVVAMETGGRGGYPAFSQQSARAEVELCGRCHRLPPDDPELPVSPDNIKNVRFQPVGLLQSRCFTESGQGLKCSACHDPHQPVVRETEHYVRRCLECHAGPRSTSCPVSPRSDCIRCHMPSVDVHRGIRFHDHWIRVRHDAEALDGNRVAAPTPPQDAEAPREIQP